MGECWVGGGVGELGELGGCVLVGDVGGGLICQLMARGERWVVEIHFEEFRGLVV